MSFTKNKFIEERVGDDYTMFRTTRDEAGKYHLLIQDNYGDFYLKRSVNPSGFDSVWAGRAGYSYDVINIPYELPEGTSAHDRVGSNVVKNFWDYDITKTSEEFDLKQNVNNPREVLMVKKEINNGVLELFFHAETVADTAALNTLWGNRANEQYGNLIDL